MEIRRSKISFASFLRLLSKPSKYLALRVDPELRHFKGRKELWFSVEFLIYSIERVIFFSPTNREASVHCARTMTRAKAVNLDINQLRVSVCYVHNRISRREILGGHNFDLFYAMTL